MKKECTTAEEFYKERIKEMVNKLSEEDAVFYYTLMAKQLTQTKKKATNCN